MNGFRIRFACLGLAAVAACTAHAQTRELGASGELLDGIAALVDDGVVLKSELASRMRIVADNFAASQAELPPDQRGQLPPLPVLEQQVLDQLIIEQIQLQRADRVGLQITDDILNQVIGRVASNVGTSFDNFPAWLESQGVDYQQFREDQRRDIIITQLEQREVVDQIMINPRELQQCLANSLLTEADAVEYNISHILIGFDPDAGTAAVAAAEAKVRDIARQLDEGADFAELAVSYSESQTALEGGLLGWRRGAELPTIFADDVRSLAPGEHSTPIRGGGGFHIVRLNDLRGREPEFVDQFRARHILLAPTELLDDDATRQRIEGVRQQILDGDDFGTVASAISDDEGSGVDGGDLGWSVPDDFVPEFGSVLQSLEIGEISEPFKTQFGWHIAQVTDRRTYDMTDELRELSCRNQIGQGKAVEESELWRQRIRNQAYVVKRI